MTTADTCMRGGGGGGGGGVERGEVRGVSS